MKNLKLLVKNSEITGQQEQFEEEKVCVKSSNCIKIVAFMEETVNKNPFASKLVFAFIFAGLIYI